MAEKEMSRAEKRYSKEKPKEGREGSRREEKPAEKKPEPKADHGDARAMMMKRHEKEHRDLHGQHRDAMRDMHRRHEEEMAQMNEPAEGEGTEGVQGEPAEAGVGEQ